MSVLSSAHVHTTYCDGKTPAIEMARAAYEKGFVSLGFTSHAPQDFDFPYCMARERESAYRAEIQALQREYAGRMAIYLGLERDAYACVSPQGYDYFIASVHYLRRPDGQYSPIDGDPEDLRRYVEEECGGDGLEMARRYFDLLRDCVLSSHAPIIGHFDLPRKNNAVLKLYDEAGPAYRRLALQSLEALRDAGAVLEVNTGAIARGYLTTPYPDAFLLKAWQEWSGPVTVTSDCHDARFLDTGFDDAEALLRSLGYTHALRLNRDPRQGLWEEYRL